MSEHKQRTRHPSTQISEEKLREACYQFYLRRLEPPMTPAESLTAVYRDPHLGTIISDDGIRRKRSLIYMSHMRDAAHVFYDLDLLKL